MSVCSPDYVVVVWSGIFWVFFESASSSRIFSTTVGADVKMSALAVSMIFFVMSTLVKMPGLDSCVWGLLLVVYKSPLWITVVVHVVFLFLTLHRHRVEPSLFCF